LGSQVGQITITLTFLVGVGGAPKMFASGHFRRSYATAYLHHCLQALSILRIVTDRGSEGSVVFSVASVFFSFSISLLTR